ncbi:unnamed protein product [Pieris brassicae]|uniref:Uncharacterized protein n=1 Tax=Pieris brassicae TaxID=7116 RepID=A0A9P0X9E8_PIEBR|nr:unnamed protein product [Pieris brassicae]
MGQCSQELLWCTDEVSNPETPTTPFSRTDTRRQHSTQRPCLQGYYHWTFALRTPRLHTSCFRAPHVTHDKTIEKRLPYTETTRRLKITYKKLDDP